MSAVWADVTTSRRQGRPREGLSEGSPSAKVRADGQTRSPGAILNSRRLARRASPRDGASNSHRRLSPRVSQHKMTKPARCKG